MDFSLFKLGYHTKLLIPSFSNTAINTSLSSSDAEVIMASVKLQLTAIIFLHLMQHKIQLLIFFLLFFPLLFSPTHPLIDLIHVIHHSLLFESHSFLAVFCVLAETSSSVEQGYCSLKNVFHIFGVL